MNSELFDVIIIGGGVSGLGAAIYSGRLELKTLVLTEKPGGTIILTDDIANYPGFRKISGYELAKSIEDHAKDYNINIEHEKVEKIEKNKEKQCYNIFTNNDKKYRAKTLIFATGTKWKKLEVPGEEEFSNKGVHYCALCDGAFYKDKIVAVVGGSDSAAKESLLLAQWAKKVYIISRGEDIRPEPINKKRVLENDKIEIIANNTVKDIIGKDNVEGIILNNDHKGSDNLNVDGVFIDIGHIPLSSVAKQIGVDLDKNDQIIIDRESKTNIDGVYAAGDVTNAKFKQAITGVAEGVTAAYSAYHYIHESDPIHFCND